MNRAAAFWVTLRRLLREFRERREEERSNAKWRRIARRLNAEAQAEMAVEAGREATR